ncbi:CHAT domain-containing protein [Singulisphaera sp. Ch08]|uniref:CHAT domain-containing protein n=1 Tax=Singulisphaera sp. Ch08 TaxID=3120278 RepID=A0AAU7CKF3_9BACT
MMRFGSGLVAAVLVFAGASRAASPAAGDRPPFEVAETPARDDLRRRFEETDVLRDLLPPQEMVEKYRALIDDAFKEYGSNAYEPYAVLDRLAGYLGDLTQSSDTTFANNIQPEPLRRSFAESTKTTRRELIEALRRSKLADWRKQGEIAKHEGLIELKAGDITKSRPKFDEAAKRLGEHPKASAFSLARVVLAQAEIACFQKRWDDAEAACDRLFHLFHDMDGRSMDVLSLDVLAKAEGQAAYHLAFSLARRREATRQQIEKYAEWVLNTKVYRREMFARQLAALRASDQPAVAKVREQLFDAWRRFAVLAVKPVRNPGDPAIQRRRADAVLAMFAKVKTIARQAARVTAGTVQAEDWVSIDRVRAALPPDSVLVDFYGFLEYDFEKPAGVMAWKSSRDIAFIIPPSGRGEVRMVDLADGEETWQAVDAYVRTLGPPATDDAAARREAEEKATEASVDVSRILLHPLLPYIKDAKRWIISPHSLTWLIPWATLGLEDGELVVDHHATSNVLSGRHVARGVVGSPRTLAAGASLIVADPDYDLGRAKGARNGVFSPLPETEAEARAIAPHLEAYTGTAPRILLGAEARESAALALPPPRVLVASTHGYYGTLPDVPLGVHSAMLRCGLAFAGANERRELDDRPGDDGVATGLEILASDFRGTELVVLSACATSYGEFQTTQGLVGLNLAFHLAGAKTVMGSLWPVPIDETTQLTTEFFSELARGTPADESLRRSQAKLVKDLKKKGGAPPWFWAAFVLSGDATRSAR